MPSQRRSLGRYNALPLTAYDTTLCGGMTLRTAKHRRGSHTRPPLLPSILLLGWCTLWRRGSHRLQRAFSGRQQHAHRARATARGPLDGIAFFSRTGSHSSTDVRYIRAVAQALCCRANVHSAAFRLFACAARNIACVPLPERYGGLERHGALRRLFAQGWASPRPSAVRLAGTWTWPGGISVPGDMPDCLLPRATRAAGCHSGSSVVFSLMLALYLSCATKCLRIIHHPTSYPLFLPMSPHISHSALFIAG